MKSSRLKEEMQSNAEELRRLQERIHETVKLRGRSEQHRREWELACREFHSRYNLLAFPGGYAGALKRITAGEYSAVEAGLSFLEVRPYFFRSGYMYKDILRALKRAPLPEPQAARLSAIAAAYEQYRADRRRKA